MRSRMVICGDPYQVDLPDPSKSGLADAVKSGAKIRVLDGPPIFTVSVAFALDKSGPDDASLLTLLNEIVADLNQARGVAAPGGDAATGR